MTILDKSVVLDTNIWIFGLRRHPDLPACAQLLERLGQLQVILPRQLLQELRANLSESELKILFHLLKQFPEKIVIDWEKAKIETIHKYQGLGCKLGDAAIAAHLEDLGIRVLITENRHFLKELKGIPFQSLNAIEALAEIEKVGKERR
jgi:predicted nucleic acid-binding protein